MATPATVEDCVGAVSMVASAVACTLDADRVAMLAEIVAGGDWTRAELRAAVGVLARSTDLRDALRYGRTLTAADFEEARAGQARKVRDDETGEERVIVTLKGYALKVRQARLYTHAEALALWTSAGAPGVLADAFRTDGTLAVYPNSMFTAVDAEGVGRRFQLK